MGRLLGLLLLDRWVEGITGSDPNIEAVGRNAELDEASVVDHMAGGRLVEGMADSIESGR